MSQETNAQEYAIGRTFSMPQESLEGLNALKETCETARVGFFAAMTMIKDVDQGYWDYIRGVLPELDGWEISVNSKTGVVTLMSRKDDDS